jgi:hypothetical protein
MGMMIIIKIIGTYCHIITKTDKQATNKATSFHTSLLTEHQINTSRLFSLQTPRPINQNVSHLPLWSGQWPGWKRGLDLAKYFVDYSWIRITEFLLCYRGINCNWKLILWRCVRFVAYRVESSFGVVGMSSCVCVSHWITEQDVRNYRQYRAVICYVRSVCKTLLYNTKCSCNNTQSYTPSQYNYTTLH